MKTVLVTGGAGFIGSRLCEMLLAEGNRVICLDNLLTGRIGHIRPLLADPSFSFIERDVAEPFRIDADRIYHLACPASPVHYREDPHRTAKTCFLGAFNVLSEAERCGARVLLASTSEVYGDPAVHPQTEDYRGSVNPDGPRACYDEGKRIAETLFFDALRTKGTDVRVVRIFNTYGPRMEAADGRIISNFISQALSGRDLTVYGDGLQTRSFCYVDDLVPGLIRMMENEPAADGGTVCKETGLPLVHGPVNLGNPSERTVLSVAEEILRLTGSASKIIFRPLPADDPARRQPDVARAKTLLGWEPAVSFEEGISRTIEWFREDGNRAE